MRKFLCLFVVVFGLFVGASPKKYALGAIPVTDYQEIIETMAVIAKEKPKTSTHNLKTEQEKEAMYHIPASQIYIPPPGYIGDSDDVWGPKPS